MKTTLKEIGYYEATQIKFNGVNRDVNSCLVSKYAKTMKDEGVDNFVPIMVNAETNNVLDGQHRVKAFIKAIENGWLDPNATLSAKYIYKADEESEVKQIINYNNEQSHWSLEHYIKSYIKQGNENYIKLNNFCETHILCKAKSGHNNARYGYAIITGEAGGAKLKGGLVTISDEQIKIGEVVHNEIFEIFKILGLGTTGNTVEAFALAWHDNREVYSFKEWTKAFKKNKNKILLRKDRPGFTWKDELNRIGGQINKINKTKEAA